jgi:hypothetical protein
MKIKRNIYLKTKFKKMKFLEMINMCLLLKEVVKFIFNFFESFIMFIVPYTTTWFNIMNALI